MQILENTFSYLLLGKKKKGQEEMSVNRKGGFSNYAHP